MKIIISHDVDHITVWEHVDDLVLPKHVVRSMVEFLLGKVTFKDFMSRGKELLFNKWQNLEELMSFDRENNIPSTFFMAVANGKGLSYSIKDAEYWINKIANNGFNVGLHGIAYDNSENIRTEYEVFKKISGVQKFGIRMHYLRMADNTLALLGKIGYLFDSTIFKPENCFKENGLWEFPLHIMDCTIFCGSRPYQVLNLEQAKEKTKRIIDTLASRGIKYFTVLFHDRYFCDAYSSWRDWYVWLIRHFKKNGVEFVGYLQAVDNEEGKPA